MKNFLSNQIARFAAMLSGKGAAAAAVASVAIVAGVAGVAVVSNTTPDVIETDTPAITEPVEVGNQNGQDTVDLIDTTDTAEDNTDDVNKAENDNKENEKAADAAPVKADVPDVKAAPAVQAPAVETVPADTDAAPGAATAAETEQETGSVQNEQNKQESSGAQVDGEQTPSGNNNQESNKPAEDNNNKPSNDVNVAAASEIVSLTNAARRENGLGDLRTETAILDGANIRAKEISQKFEHTRPDGSSCFTVISGNYGRKGENIAYCSGKASAAQFVDMWMNSTGHRANILNADYDGIAVGVYYDESANITYAVQLFVEDAAGTEYTFTEEVVAPTCTEQGYTLHKCNEDDSKSYKDTYVDALGHAWDEGSVTTEPICTENGVKTFTCTRCQETKTEDIQANGHTEEVQGAKDATCTENGYTGDTVCSVCGEVLKKGEVIEANGHNYVDGKCTVCGEIDPDYTPETEYTYIEEVVAPTCTEKGYTMHTCVEDASKSYQDSFVDALGHDYKDGVCTRCDAKDPDYKPELTFTETVVEPTCTEPGYTLHECKEDPSLSYKDTPVPAKGHAYDPDNGVCTRCGAKDPDYKPEVEYTFTEEVVAPTCTEKGYTLHKCNEDDSKSYKDTYVDALGHAWDEGSVTTEPTCTENGVKTFACTRCQETKTEDIQANGHTEEVQNAKDATCTENGYTGDTVCSVCGEVLKKGEVIEANGHSYADGKCTVCGAEDPNYEPPLTFTENVVAPTCTEKGYTEHICAEDPSKNYTDSYVDPLGHDFDGKNLGAKCTRCGTDLFVFKETVAPTCAENGYDVYVSILDPNETRKDNFTDTIDHNFVDGYCTECGKKDDTFLPSYDDNYDASYYNSVIISRTNSEREARGHKALRYASEYQSAADIRAQELTVSFSHTRPNGTSCDTALSEAGANYTAVGENIAYVSSMYKPDRIVDNWLNSPGHFTNMMNDKYDSFVVGTACANGKVYAVQIFFRDSFTDWDGEVDVIPQELELEEDILLDESMTEEDAEITEQPTEEVVEETPDMTEDVVEEVPEESPAPTPEVTEEPAPTPEPTPEPTPAPTPAPTPEATPAPTPEVIPTPAPEQVVEDSTPAVEETPVVEEEATPTPEPAPEEEPVQQDVIAPPEESVVVPQAEEAPDDSTPDTDILE